MQYGEYCTQLRDIAAAAGLHHFAVRAVTMPLDVTLQAPAQGNASACASAPDAASSATGENAAAAGAADAAGAAGATVPCGSAPLGCAGVRLALGHAVGAPGSFCPSMSYASRWAVTVEPAAFRAAARDALTVTGLAALACECDGAGTGADWWSSGNGGLR